MIVRASDLIYYNRFGPNLLVLGPTPNIYINNWRSPNTHIAGNQISDSLNCYIHYIIIIGLNM